MPGTEQVALWAAIRANPDDDTPRLVYADWLQENGEEERAEFIRVQCQLAAIETQRENRREAAQLRARSDRILGPNRRRWTQALFDVVHSDLNRQDREAVKRARQWQGGTAFKRGFAAPSLTLDQATRVVEVERTLEPLNRVKLHSYEASYEARRVPVLRAIAQHNTLCFYSLYLRYTVDKEAEILASAPWLARVESLSFVDGQLSDVGVTALFQGRPTGRLRLLNLCENRIDTPGVIALAGSPFLSGVTHLHITDNHIGDSGAIALAESPNLSHVTWITLDGNPIGPEGWRRLRERFGGCIGTRGHV
jgi:uncharacterized protein (TIGR02996 family)